MTEFLLIILCLWGEVRGESHEGIQAVLNVIKNRTIKSERTYKEIILAPKQFSYFNLSKKQIWNDIAKIRRDRDEPTIEALIKIAINVTVLDTPDNSLGATHYHTTAINPYWAEDMDTTIVIGNHVFLKEK